jgi:hypothetical protein
MSYRPAEQFLYTINRFIGRQSPCTDAVMSTERELMVFWQQQYLMLKFNNETWEEKIALLTRAGCAVLFLFEIFDAHLNENQLQLLKWLLASLTLESLDIDGIIDFAGKYIDEGVKNIFESILKNDFDNKLRDDINEQLDLSPHYKARLSTGSSYIPMHIQLQRLLPVNKANNEKSESPVINPQKKDKGKGKEKESRPMREQAIGLLTLSLLEKIASVKLEISYYINNRVCRQCIFHHPKFNLALLNDNKKLELEIIKLSSLTQSKVNNAIKLINKIDLLEKEILRKDVELNKLHNYHYYRRQLNSLIDKSVQQNKHFDQQKMLPYVPGMSSGYERVLLKNICIHF